MFVFSLYENKNENNKNYDLIDSEKRGYLAGKKGF